MEINIKNLHLSVFNDNEEVKALLSDIKKTLNKMGEELNNLTAEVTETKGIMASAKALIEGFAQKLEEAGTDKAKLAALKDELNSGSEDLAAAITANPLPEENVVNPGAGENTDNSNQPT